MKVLLVRLSAIGDIVHTMPTAVAIKREHPEWQLDWVVQKEMAGLLRQHPAIDNLIEIGRRPSREELRDLKRSLRAENYDIALDMQGLYKSGRIVGMSGAAKRLGYHWQRELSWMFSRAVKTPPGLHVVEQYLAVAEFLGCSGKPVEFGLRPTENATKSAEEKFADLRLEGRRLALNLGAGKPEKRWPVERYAELVPLAKLEGWAPFAVGGPGDRATYEELKSKCPDPPPSLVGATTLEELVAVLSLADGHVGGDTGSTHIAAALGKPVACMMGPTDPKRSGPYGLSESTVSRVRGGLSEITAEQVMEALSLADARSAV